MAVLPTGIGPVTGGYQIERSLRFNSADSAYLNRTFASAGNRATWTWSAWVKRSFLDATATSTAFQTLFHAGVYTTVAFSADSIYFQMANGAGSAWYIQTSQVFRDPSAWYHIVAVLNTTAATPSQRMRLYINGVEVTAFSTDQRTSITLNTTSGEINNNISHAIGGNTTPARYFSGYQTETYFIDGQALTPLDFGETDTNTGVWKPKAYTGTYGTNGFYLPFKTASQWSGYFDGTGDYLTIPSSASLQLGANTFTVEGWFYQTTTTSTAMFVLNSSASYAALRVQTDTANTISVYLSNNGSSWANQITNIGNFPVNTWNHIAITRDGTTGAILVYQNGSLIGSGTNASALHAGTVNYINAIQSGGSPGAGTAKYISNFRVVIGTNVYPSPFTPPTSQLTAITNTRLLTCQSSTFVDNSTNAFTITVNGDSRAQQFSPFTLDVTDDHSGQGNHWIPNNLDLRTTGVGADIMVDSPTSYGTDTGVGGEVRGNYCTLNPLDKTAAVTLSNGNLQALLNGINYFSKSTIAISSGKWYWEVTASATAEDMIGITKADVATTGYFGSQATSYGYYKTNGNKYNSGTGTAYGASYASGDIIGVALDLDAGTLTYYKNGVSQGTAFTGLSGTFFAGVSTAGSGGTQTINFGQRAFEKWNGSAYVANTAPSGFKALCTQNFTTPTIGATSTTQASKYFNVKLYSGNGNTGQTITGVGFQPDFTWLKNRNMGGGYFHLLYDAVRGAGYNLRSDSTDAETNRTAIFSAFTSDGFTFPAGQGNTIENDSVGTYASWNWNAGGSTVTNTSGTISSQVRANTTSGFSIVTYTGNGSANQTVGHGLGVAPTFGILKDRDLNSNNSQWQVFHTGAGDNYAYLSTTAAFAGTAEFYPTSGSSTTVTVGRGSPVATTNESGDRFVMYLFADVEGYSKAFSYVSNNSTDNAFVYLGFRPRWIMIKSESTGGVNYDWVIYDTARMTYNYIANTDIRANLTITEGGTARNPAIDILSNGFKVRSSAGEIGSSTLYVGMAFAETPFKYSLAR